METDELSTKPPCLFVTVVTCSATRAISSTGISSSSPIVRSILRLRWPGAKPPSGGTDTAGPLPAAA